MMKNKFLVTMLLIFTVMLAACSGGNGDTAKTGNGGNAEVDDVVKMVWYPNESGEDMKVISRRNWQAYFRGNR